MITKNDTVDKIIFMQKQIEHEPKISAKKVEIDKEEIIETLKVIESLKRKWLSYIK